MVISQKMALHLHWLKCTTGDIGVFNLNAVELQLCARKMDNRGSKSNNIMFVKEQRVDGSYINLKSSGLMLRCTLRGFERITWAGISPNQILNKGLYSTAARNEDSKNFLKPNLSNKYEESFYLNPWFITGFTDGDGSFAISGVPPPVPLLESNRRKRSEGLLRKSLV